MQRTITVGGKTYRQVDLTAADTAEAGRHISAEPPVSFATQQAERVSWDSAPEARQ